MVQPGLNPKQILSIINLFDKTDFITATATTMIQHQTTLIKR